MINIPSEWLRSGAVVPVNVETTALLVAALRASLAALPQQAAPVPSALDWWATVDNILKEYGLEAITFVSDFKKAQESAPSESDALALLREARDALALLMQVFPTDGDMVQAGWNAREVDDACNAHDSVQATLSKIDALLPRSDKGRG